jgi:hypothetical protein
LDISKIEAGEMSLDIKDFSLQQTVNSGSSAESGAEKYKIDLCFS